MMSSSASDYEHCSPLTRWSPNSSRYLTREESSKIPTSSTPPTTAIISPNTVSFRKSHFVGGKLLTQTGLHPGKECGYDTDIHIPFAVRGPGVPIGHISNHVTSHTDIAKTVLGLAGATREEFDGALIPIHELEESVLKTRSNEHVNIEFWGKAIPEGIWGEYGDGKLPIGLWTESRYTDALMCSLGSRCWFEGRYFCLF